MTQTLYFDFTFMSRREAYYLFYKNYPTSMVFAQTDGIELVLLNHTRTRGPSVTRMQDFSFYFLLYNTGRFVKKIKCNIFKNIVLMSSKIV